MRKPKKKNYIFKSSQGQISIFLAMSLMAIMALLAFIINVGSFVKAKINLQNAVDSAAWAGAAVQSRQLSRIAHLNWELRNNYKEWMFKYYVLGQLGLKSTQGTTFGDTMNYRLPPFERTTSGVTYNAQAFDKYNVPSICIHQGSGFNLCEIATLPGLPRFSSVGLQGISQHHESTLTSFVDEKALDCSRRTRVNAKAAQTWAYGVGTNSEDSYAQIAGDRPGAWIKALEIALRIRNLEYQVNLPPSELPICKTQNEQTGNCSPIDQIPRGRPLYERQHKAFQSAFKNLGGGILKDSSGDELSSTFTLQELKPLALDTNPSSLSGFLIPPSADEFNPLKKSYLDLIINPINYVTFFTFFAARDQEAANIGVKMEGACSGTKVALPVPGFIMGFYKNPQVLTYYAVKGESKYTGLFNPFRPTSIKLSAYAAAKPMGGRIGPRIFETSDNQSLSPRGDPSLSAPFATALKPESSYEIGYPLPTDDNFWAKANDMIGGTPATSGNMKFVIPNLIYDFENDASEVETHQAGGSGKLVILTPAINITASVMDANERVGLYDGNQFKMLRKNLEVNSPSNYSFSQKEINDAIARVRTPTKYDRINYMIPSASGDTKNDNPKMENVPDATGFVDPQSGMRVYNFYAPLYGQDTLFPNGVANIDNVIKTYLTILEPSIDSFIQALKKSADDMRNADTKGKGVYDNAADSIYKDGYDNLTPAKCPGNVDTNISLAGQMNQFFKGGSDDVCGIKSVSAMATSYMNKGNDFKNRYSDFYFVNTKNIDIYSAYSPGTRQGADPEGVATHPYSGKTTFAKRNFYSTKLIKMDKVMNSGDEAYGQLGAIFLESGHLQGKGSLDQNVNNLLSIDQLEGFGTLHY